LNSRLRGGRISHVPAVPEITIQIVECQFATDIPSYGPHSI
jgi:hypothetical protein